MSDITQTNPSTDTQPQEPAEINYGAEIINLVAELNAKDAALSNSIRYAGTINKDALKNCMRRAYRELTIISWMYTHQVAVCNKLTDIIRSCVKTHLGAANSEEPPEVNVKFTYSGLFICYMYVLNDSTIIIPILGMEDARKINIFHPYRVIGYHNSYGLVTHSRTPLCIYSSDNGLSTTQQKKIIGEILKCLNNPPLANI